MLEVIIKSLPVFIAIFLGKLFATKKWLPEKASNIVSTIAFKIISPFFVFDVLYGVIIQVDKIYLILSPILMFTAILLLSYLGGKLILGLLKEQLGTFVLCMITFGAGSVYPFVVRNFSEDIFREFVIVDMIVLFLFLLLGPGVARLFSNKKSSNLTKTITSMIKDPILLTIAGTFIINYIGIEIPREILEIPKFFTSSFFVLAALLVGLTLEVPKSKEILKLIGFFVIRIGIVIAITLLLMFIFSLDKYKAQPLFLVFVTQFSVLAAIFAKEYNLDDKLASQLVLLSMIIQLGIYPILISILV